MPEEGPSPVDATKTDVEFESFYVEAHVSAARRRPLVAAIRREVGASNLIPLGDDRDRMLVVPRRRIGAGDAWEEARSLAEVLRGERAGGVVVEPLFATTAKAEKSKKKGLGSETPLPCAANDCDWSLDVTDTAAAWSLVPPPGGTSMGEGVRVGHPDTGYTKHPQIWATSGGPRRLRADLGYDFEDGRKDPLDPLVGSAPGHGTSTASVIMSDSGGPSPFVTGVAPRCELVPLRVSTSVIHFSFTNVTRAIYHAVDEAKVDLISMSLGGPIPSAALEAAISHAKASGVVVLAAAGNVWPWVVYPARYDDVVAVAACNCRLDPWKRSASGSAVDITAPGESVWRALTHKNGTFDVKPSSGTSYAVATTAGACALWIAWHGGRAKLASRLGGASRIGGAFLRAVRASAKPPASWDHDDYGAGILNAKQLLETTLSSVAPKSKKKGKVSAARGVDPLEAIADFLPEERRDAGIARLERRLGKTPGERRANLAVLGPELVFQVGTDEALRRQLARTSQAARAKAAAAPLDARRGSKRLRAVLKG